MVRSNGFTIPRSAVVIDTLSTPSAGRLVSGHRVRSGELRSPRRIGASFVCTALSLGLAVAANAHGFQPSNDWVARKNRELQELYAAISTLLSDLSDPRNTPREYRNTKLKLSALESERSALERHVNRMVDLEDSGILIYLLPVSAQAD